MCETPHGPAIVRAVPVRAFTARAVRAFGFARRRARRGAVGTLQVYGALNQSPELQTSPITSMIVAYSSEPYPSRVASQISFLFYSVNVFQDRHRVGSVPAARARGPHSPPSQRRSMTPTGPSGRYTASRGSSHRLGAAPLAPGPTLSLAARRRALCLGVVWCRSCGPSRTVKTPVPAPPMPHPARPLPSAPLVTMPQGR